MAHNSEFSCKDLELIVQFLRPFKAIISGNQVLDLAGGNLGRCHGILSKFYQTVDCYDLKPGFSGKLSQGKRGKLYTGSLKDIDKVLGEKNYHQYDAVFGNWVLSYLNYTDVLKLLVEVWWLLKPGGIFILKESVLFD